MRIRFDPRMKLYLLLLANLLLFFHVNTTTEACMTFLFILPFFLSGYIRMGIRFGILYGILLAMDSFLIPVASGFWLNLLSLLSVGIRMMLPCFISGAYAFATTTPGELISALRKMRIPESIIITTAVVIRFFPTVMEDYRQIRSAMALRGISVGLRHPARSLEYVLIPLLMNENTVAQDLSVAALTKGIGIKGKHTCLTENRIRIYDCFYMLLCTCPLLLYLWRIV